MKADLTHARECEKVILETHKKFGRVDILGEQRGALRAGGAVEEYPLEEFEKVINVHLARRFC